MSLTIAFAIDFKKLTPKVITSGLFLKKYFPEVSKIILFHAIEYFLTPPAYLQPYLEKEKQRLEQDLKALSQSYFNEEIKKNITIETKVILGNFWEALSKFIHQVNPFVVVLGYLPHLLKVPTAEKMVERLNCNFLVVKETPLTKLKRLGCLIDFSESSKMGLNLTTLLSRNPEVEVFCLNVIQPPDFIKKTFLNHDPLEEEINQRNRLWQEWLKSFSNNQEFIQKLRFEIAVGNRLEKIEEFVKKQQIDLLIMGKRGKMVQKGLGSIAREVIKKIEIPILVVDKV
ncbi:universal stress protein [Thermodesulfobacterium sp. TA1]|uniref:universal stress protein n=1 Tax=Thermodesulfobacterium sp. TA1 TaxID=2234087 RepID=UPI001231A6A1|nr:universal stress protein [Thermodesulfobacterium sp. TA1]QER42099.1 universal stress protein [Thermodesulfobacterium sp. TA1]